MPPKQSKSYKKTYAIHLLFLIALLATFQCLAEDKAPAKRQATKELPEITDSRKRLSELANFYWVDEHRILFEGLNGEEIVRPDGYKVLLQSLFLWNTESGELDDRGEIGGGLCYAQGYVRYRKWEKKGTELGAIVAGDLNGDIAPAPNLAGVRIDPHTCHPRTEARPLPDWTDGKSVRRLKQEHGFLVLGAEKENRNTPVTYHPNGAFQGVLMPFKRREARFGLIEYVGFKGAYFIEGDYFVSASQHPHGGYNKTPWPRGVPIPVWWLYADGRVVEVQLPSEARDASWTFPAKNGFYFVSHRYPTADGLYKASLSKVGRILKGSISKYSVSPSGCSIAVNHDGDYNGTRGKGTLKSINVCSTGD